MTLQESTLSTGIETKEVGIQPAVKKRWFSFKAKGKAQGFTLAENEDEVARNVGIPRERLKIEPAVWNGKRFVVKKGK